MKDFAKVFLVVGAVVFAVVSFIRFDININEWGEAGRGAYLFFVFGCSLITTGVIKQNKSN